MMDKGLLDRSIQELELIDLQMQVLAEELTEASEAMKAPGRPPAPSLFERITKLTTKFERLRSEWTDSLKTSPSSELAPQDIQSISDFRTFHEAAKKELKKHNRKEALRSKVDDLARKVAQLTSNDPRMNSLLTDLKREAQQLQDELRTPEIKTSSKLKSLIEGTHPLQRLVDWLGFIDDIENAHWAECYELVSKTYGPVLAAGISRGLVRLAIKPEPAPQASSPEPETEAPSQPPQKEEEPEDAATPLDVSIKFDAENSEKFDGPSSAENANRSDPIPVVTAGIEKPDTIRNKPERKLSEEVKEAEEKAPEDNPPVLEQPQATAETSFSSGNEPSDLEDSSTAVTTSTTAASLEQKELDTVWELLESKRYPLAYHLLNALEKQDSVLSELRASMIRALVLSQITTSSADISAQDFAEIVHKIIAELDSASSDAALIVLGLSLRPCLLAPGTDARILLQTARQILVDSNTGLKELVELSDEILSHAVTGIDLSPFVLKGVHQKAAWEEQLKSLQENCQNWTQQNRQGRVVFGVATDVLRATLEPDASPGKALAMIQKGERSKKALEFLEKELNNLGSQQRIRVLIHRTDEATRGKKASINRIEGKALKSLEKRIKEALSFPRRWLDLVAEEPRQEEDYRHHQVDQCRTLVLNLIPEIQKQLGPKKKSTSSAERAVASVLSASLNSLADLFDPGTPPPTTGLIERYELNPVNLQLIGHRLTDDWLPTTYRSPDLIEAYSELAQRDSTDWARILDLHMDCQDHKKAGWVIEYLDFLGAPHSSESPSINLGFQRRQSPAKRAQTPGVRASRSPWEASRSEEAQFVA